MRRIRKLPTLDKKGIKKIDYKILGLVNGIEKFMFAEDRLALYERTDKIVEAKLKELKKVL